MRDYTCEEKMAVTAGAPVCDTSVTALLEAARGTASDALLLVRMVNAHLFASQTEAGNGPKVECFRDALVDHNFHLDCLVAELRMLAEKLGIQP